MSFPRRQPCPQPKLIKLATGNHLKEKTNPGDEILDLGHKVSPWAQTEIFLCVLYQEVHYISNFLISIAKHLLTSDASVSMVGKAGLETI